MASNYDKLKAYFESAKDLPYRGGQPNKTVIAKEAGCAGRQPFYDSERCSQLLEEWTPKFPARNAPSYRAKEATLERKNRELEAKNAKLFAEKEALERKLRKVEHLEALRESGRRVQP